MEYFSYGSLNQHSKNYRIKNDSVNELYFIICTDIINKSNSDRLNSSLQNIIINTCCICETI